MAGDVLIRFEDVHKAFGRQKVLDGMTLEIRRGETLAQTGTAHLPVQYATDSAEIELGPFEGRLHQRRLLFRVWPYARSPG